MSFELPPLTTLDGMLLGSAAIEVAFIVAALRSRKPFAIFGALAMAFVLWRVSDAWTLAAAFPESYQ